MAATISDARPEAVRAGDGEAPAPPEPVVAPASPAPTRVHVGELISSGSALALVVLLFAVKWYGIAGVPDPSYARPAISTAENGWDALSAVRWVILATVLVALGSVFLHASQRRHGARTDTSRIVTAAGALTSVLLVYRVLIALPNGAAIDQKLGAILGLFCALGVAVGGIESIEERRLHPVGVRHRRHSSEEPSQ
jgi:hypothetical protein